MLSKRILNLFSLFVNVAERWDHTALIGGARVVENILLNKSGNVSRLREGHLARTVAVRSCTAEVVIGCVTTAIDDL